LPDPPVWQTDRQTDGRTDRRTELRWLRRAIAVPAVARKNVIMLLLISYKSKYWWTTAVNNWKKIQTKRALGERKPPPTICQFFPLCSPGGSTIFRGGLPYLAMVKDLPLIVNDCLTSYNYAIYVNFNFKIYVGEVKILVDSPSYYFRTGQVPTLFAGLHTRMTWKVEQTVREKTRTKPYDGIVVSFSTCCLPADEWQPTTTTRSGM